MLLKELFPQTSTAITATDTINITDFPEHKFNYTSAGEAAERGDTAHTEFF